MQEWLEKLKNFSVAEKLKTFKFHRFNYLPKDDINRYPHQYPAHGLAVTSLVVAVAHILTLGIFPPFSCFAMMGSLLAFFKGNRRLVVFAAFVLGLFGLLCSVWLKNLLGGFVANPESFLAMFAK